MKKSDIYTKTGDNGTTGLVGGKRISKASEQLDGYGTIDELNSHIGVLMAEELPKETCELLRWIQHKLFIVGANLASDLYSLEHSAGSILKEDAVSRLEEAIDTLDNGVPPMKGFILPQGCRTAALCHVCRTVCRRAERCIYKIYTDGKQIDPVVARFVNRLSDYFFVLARAESYRITGDEVLWDASFEL